MLQDPSTVEPALDLILISRPLERIGEHATNIAEDVIVMGSALDGRHHPPIAAEPRTPGLSRPVTPVE
jgi:phosphate transport system protein